MSKALYQTGAIKQLEKLAMEQGLTEVMLMERAGDAAWSYLQRIWPDAKRITIFCGGGNNGGDGFVVARLARRAGFDVKIFCVGSYKDQSPTAQQMQQQCQKLGISMVAYTPSMDIKECDVIVDAIVGTGLTRPLTGVILEAVKAINHTRLPVLALDVPTGINADTGEAMGNGIYARHTITFIALKVGLVTGPALNFIGSLSLATLNFNHSDSKPAPAAIMYDKPPVFLLRRPRDSHKGMFGHVAIVGGNYGMSGAPRIAAGSALRSGAGLVTVITRPEHAATMNIMMPEIMCTGIDGVTDMPPSLESATTWAIGPGLGHDRWAGNMMHFVLKQKLPVVIDADGLRWLSKHPSKHDNWILTPHPGEAAALLDIDSTKIQTDRLKAAKELQRRYGGMVILKGAGTVIAYPDELPRICVNTGNPGMASAGMGDCLTGIIAALLAQRVPPNEATALGVWVHGKAGDLAAADGGERGLLASDLLPYIRKLLNSI